jgi:hypothetical protein
MEIKHEHQIDFEELKKQKRRSMIKILIPLYTFRLYLSSLSFHRILYIYILTYKGIYASFNRD